MIVLNVQSSVCFSIGSRHCISILTCDSVMEGAFFPQPDNQVPKKEMGHNTGEHMVVPPLEFSHFVVVHSKLSFALFKSLLNSPTKTTKPN